MASSLTSCESVSGLETITCRREAKHHIE
jgi:hypothetical protein